MNNLKLHTKKTLVKLTSKLTLKQLIFTLLAVLLACTKFFYGYKVYCLVYEWCDVFAMLVHVDIINTIRFGDFVTVMHESKTNIFIIDSKAYNVLVRCYKKFSTLLFWSFVIMVITALIFVPQFSVWHFIPIIAQDYALHNVVHFLKQDKANRWYTCIKYINKCKRYLKKKSHPPKAVSHEKE